VANARNAVGRVQNEDVRGKIAVRVHVPEAWNEELARGIDDAYARPNADAIGRCNFGDTVANNQDRLIVVHNTTLDIHDIHMSERKAALRCDLCKTCRYADRDERPCGHGVHETPHESSCHRRPPCWRLCREA
jgi:hypothetical protein